MSWLCRIGFMMAAGVAVHMPLAAQQPVSFARDIQPIFAARCEVCHGAQQQMSGLRLDNRDAALKGGYSGAVIKPHDAESSRLIRLVSGEDDKVVMPPAGERLGADEVALLRAWIDRGAEWPVDAAADSNERTVSNHWAFQPVLHGDPPPVADENWVRNGIDRFVLARLEKEGIAAAPEAGRSTLARRLSLDLIGLPPTQREVDEFLRDKNPNAYERYVDSLLESPHYGERWAIPWLDLTRYADSDGYEKDYGRPYAWRYRDWVIDALNGDMPFDRFAIEQIAGDVMPNATLEQEIATGFHRNTLKNREGGVKLEQFRFEETVDRANTVGTVFLGLTVGCAQCHDHKYDPTTQKDYYSFFAVFNNLDEVDIEAPLAGELGPYLNHISEYRAKRRELLETRQVVELQPVWEAQMKEARANPGKWTDWDHAYDALQKYLDGSDRMIDTPVAERSEYVTEQLTDHFVKNYHRVISKERWKELGWSEVYKQLQALRAEYPQITRAQAVEESPLNRSTFVHIRGDWKRPGIEVSPAPPGFLSPMDADGKHPRLAFAEWVASRDNPLTARVAVNRIWQEHFGRGIVATSDDFGTRADAPSHPELLDWLAGEFIESGWSMKKLHKLIVMSAVYRQSSAARPKLEKIDPNNVLLARQTRLRLIGELIRDSALRVSGLLYPQVGGPSVRPPQPDGVAALSYGSSMTWNESTGADRYRRGLYIYFQRTVPYPQLISFDVPNRDVTACSRERSNTPLQALNLLNDPVFVEAARALAVNVVTGQDRDLDARLRRVFRLALQRDPSEKELAQLADYYREQTRIFESEPAAAAEMMPPELSTAGRVEAAAWTGVASVLLNLDEFITRE